jgi:hypothetical protein
VAIFFSLFLIFLFYSFIFPVFFAFGNYKDWVRFYSRLNVTAMILLFITTIAFGYVIFIKKKECFSKDKIIT